MANPPKSRDDNPDDDDLDFASVMRREGVAASKTQHRGTTSMRASKTTASSQKIVSAQKSAAPAPAKPAPAKPAPAKPAPAKPAPAKVSASPSKPAAVPVKHVAPGKLAHGPDTVTRRYDQLLTQKQALAREHEALRAEHEALRRDHDQILADHRRLQADYEQALAAQAAATTAHAEVSAARQVLADEHARVLAAQQPPAQPLGPILAARGLTSPTEYPQVLGLLLADTAGSELLAVLETRAPATLQAALERRVQLLCADEARPADAVVWTVEPARCELCSGSDVQRAAHGFALACRAAQIHRVRFVGGTPRYRTLLADLFPADGPVTVVTVAGTKRIALPKARAQQRSTDLVIIWAGTELDHATSEAYRAQYCRVEVIPHRGLARMLELAAIRISG